MPDAPTPAPSPQADPEFAKRLARLKADLVEQGRRVQAMIESAFDAAFSQDEAAAKQVIDSDELIDRVDVEIEKAAVRLLADATNNGSLSHADLRMILTIVKVNNELERIADGGVSVAEQVPALAAGGTPAPDILRVMTNSVIGIVRDVTRALDRLDADLALWVLRNEDAVDQFKSQLIRDAQQQLAAGTLGLDQAFVLQQVANLSKIMASHCVNIAEQTLYVTTGKIMRHTSGSWEEVQLPKG